MNAIPLGNLFWEAERTENALAYAGLAVNGATIQWENAPTRMALSIEAAGGAYLAGSVDAAVETSADGINWIVVPGVAVSFTADGVKAAGLNVPIMPYLRATYDGLGSANLTTAFLANNQAAPFTASTFYAPTADSTGFAFCQIKNAIDTALPYLIATPGNTVSLAVNAQAGFAEFIVAARTAGTITARLQYSFDGGLTWLNSGNVTAALGANGTFLLGIEYPVGGLARVLYTPAGGFDGTIACAIFSDVALGAVT